ncbi:MAG TPA: NAD-dependent epimerase/dehydratase family protein [Longimicrobiales bacterium]|nr:NAD-dependent epimerase/dehydratase family protein [Longimicrobiales bacterium]
MSASAPEGALVYMSGATGFIGGRLARALSARGYRLRCLVRSPERATGLTALGAELVVGDAADEAVVARALAGVRLACHLAGTYDLGAVDEMAMERVNVGGTRAFIAALRTAGVERAIYTSSTAALGPATGVGSDDDVYNGPYPSIYHRTKTEAHHLARAAQREGLPLVIVCPALVYGPGDEGPSGRYVKDVLRHRVPGLSTKPAWFSYAHVDDVASGMVAALERGRPGATYVLSGEHASVNDFTQRIAKLGGTWAPPLRVPPFMIRLTGSLMDALGGVLGKRLPVSRELAETAATGERWVHSHARASAELGYAPRSLDEGLPETVRDAQAQIGH